MGTSHLKLGWGRAPRRLEYLLWFYVIIIIKLLLLLLSLLLLSLLLLLLLVVVVVAVVVVVVVVVIVEEAAPPATCGRAELRLSSLWRRSDSALRRNYYEIPVKSGEIPMTCIKIMVERATKKQKTHKKHNSALPAPPPAKNRTRRSRMIPWDPLQTSTRAFEFEQKNVK